MYFKIKKFLTDKDFYKLAVVIVCLNFTFAVIYGYRFQTDIEIFYFILFGFVSAIKVKNIIKKRNDNYLPVFYYIWPVVILFISFFSLCKLSLLPLVISSFVIVFFGISKKKFIQSMVIVIDSIVLIMYILFWWFFINYVSPITTIIETVYSPDNQYVMILEQTDLMTNGEVDLYVGRNIDFGILGRYKPVRRKYHGHSDDRPDIKFIDDNFISINGEVIERRGNYYIDDY